MITDIHLENFRSYKNELFEFGDGVNIIVGPNASGKTNLLEAIAVATTGKSFRSRDVELIKFGEQATRIELHTLADDHRVVYISSDDQKTDKEFKINDQQFKRMTLPKAVPTVIFEPSDLLILAGPPEYRRNFIDNILEQTVPDYSDTKRRYKRALGQRNSLLKNQPIALKQLFVWDVQLSELGARIVEQRLKLIETINGSASKHYNTISASTNKVVLEYSSKLNSANYASNLLKALERNRNVDLAQGFTSSGPHRDDIRVFLNDQHIADRASRGETRTLLLVCKFIELELVQNARGAKPIVLLDDVFSELDGNRRKTLTDFLRDHQTFITTTDADIVLQHFMNNCTVIPLGGAQKSSR
jgi:DNA replication and repair protein RecF